MDVEHIRRQLAAVDDPLQFLTGIIASAPFGLQIYDLVGRCILFNLSFVRLNNGPPSSDYNVLKDPSFQPLAYQVPLQRAFTGEPVELPPLWLHPSNGQPSHVQPAAVAIFLFPLHASDGRMTYIVAVFQDRTFDELLIGLLGHELRNPLSAVLLSAGFLERETALNPIQSRFLMRILHTSRRMARLVNDLLDFVRIRMGDGLPIRIEPIDLEVWAIGVMEELRITHPSRMIQIEARGDLKGVWDPDRLTQMMLNLVANALKHGAVNHPVQVTIEGQGDHVGLSVYNEGNTIPAQELPTLFGAFQQGDTAYARRATSGGLGLGLFVVEQIVVAHGGQIQVNSRDGEGTTFQIFLPRDTAGQNAMPIVSRGGGQTPSPAVNDQRAFWERADADRKSSS